MGVSNILTFDAHDPRVMNAIPLHGFDNFFPTYQFLKALLKCVPDLRMDNDHLMIISPDEGAMSRAVYFSNILGLSLIHILLSPPVTVFLTRHPHIRTKNTWAARSLPAESRGMSCSSPQRSGTVSYTHLFPSGITRTFAPVL